jgi:hypothetical protein
MSEKEGSPRVADQFSHHESYPGKFGAAVVVIERLQRQIEFLTSGLREIKVNEKWSGQKCRDSAAFTLERWKNV